VGVPFVAWRAGDRSGRRLGRVRADLTAELVELLRGAPELVVLGADAAAMERIRRLDAELVRLSRRDGLASGVVEGLGTLVLGVTVIGVLTVAVNATAAGAMDRVLVAAIVLGTMAAFDAITPLAAAALGLRGTLEAGARLVEIGSRSPSVTDPVGPAAPPIGSSVTLERVRADHGDPGEWGLRDVSLDLASGRRVALVGPSGAGKSTVAALLVRFLDPHAGRVALGDVDIRTLRQRDVRSGVTLDGQDGYLFSSTIRENVRLARPDAEDEEIEHALRRARAWEWVASLPGGLDTHVGEEGAAVSGGERRRIALARTFLGGAPVMVLDEPTAHLDPDTAEELMRDVMSATDGRSVLVITHRTEGLLDVDEVATLRRGRLVPA
jgi:thiol reductant ABC exporter CydC subunit